MYDVIPLDKSLSTTRLLRKALAQVKADQVKEIDNPEDKCESVLFLPQGNGRKGEGGLRTKGYFKKSYKRKPLVSIVTVVYNGELFLEKTIQSVIHQTYDNVEYIIIDGASTDGTLDIIRKYEDAIDYWVSEKDMGIYDAMNKGIRLVMGQWINFMNGGDTFYETKSIKKVFDKQDFNSVDIIYGNHHVVYSSGRERIVKAGNLKNLWKGVQFCHQASFVKRHYHKIHNFNQCIKIAADFEFFYNAWKSNAIFKFTNASLVRIEAGGVSDVNRVNSILERWLLVDKSMKIIIFYCLIVIKESYKLRAKRIFYGALK